MKTIQTKSGEILLVKVPEDTTWWKITKNSMGEFITKTLGLNQMFLQYGKHSSIMGKSVPNTVYYAPKDFYLPKGNWEIVGKFSELKDEIFEEFVDFALHEGRSCNVYRNYLKLARNYILSSSKDSFKCLCESQGIDDDLSNYLIIKKL